MITKKTLPIFGEKSENGKSKREVIGTQVSYRFLGVLFYKKTMFTPAKFGVDEYEVYYTRI